MGAARKRLALEDEIQTRGNVYLVTTYEVRTTKCIKRDTHVIECNKTSSTVSKSVYTRKYDCEAEARRGHAEILESLQDGTLELRPDGRTAPRKGRGTACEG